MSEKVTKVYNGFLMLAVGFILLIATALLFIFSQDGSIAWYDCACRRTVFL
jgi:hypothetical protein